MGDERLSVSVTRRSGLASFLPYYARDVGDYHDDSGDGDNFDACKTDNTKPVAKLSVVAMQLKRFNLGDFQSLGTQSATRIPEQLTQGFESSAMTEKMSRSDVVVVVTTGRVDEESGSPKECAKTP